ncbi:MAG: single-stranded DNA-binding protein [Defluviitaleaceae bacterium]|nr:single-stranded DNA-binding protein [Defluviitaleaceae bacterium]
MLNDNGQSTNSIEIRGKVASPFTFSHEVYGEGFYSFMAETERLSESVDLLPVTVSERLTSGMGLVPGDLINIYGQVRSYNNYIQEERRNRLLITVFAREIERLEAESITPQNPNNVFLDGFICKKPIFRETPFGREIADILLAVNRSYNKSDYIPCICWGRNAKFAATLEVSDNVRINGRLQSRVYQKKYDNGTVVEKTAYEISISKIELVKEI